METSKLFGLIGKNISYSFSQKFFEDKFRRLLLNNHQYHIFDLKDLTNITEIFKTQNLIGLNVTVPFKEQILLFLDEINEEAKEIGAVNTILIKNGKTKGYNTDVFGFEKSLILMKKEHQKSALILGNGGAAKAVQFVLKKNNIPFETVYRKGDLNFENLDDKIVSEHQIIVQCTPVGTFPNIDDCIPFPFHAVSQNHLAIDLIYNPAITLFLKNCAKQGAKTLNGLLMLEQQAEKSWDI